MLQVAFAVLIVALVAAILGFGGIIGAAVSVAEILLGAFVVLFFLSIVLDRQQV
jgi:uncharacterized membrane protein YtjA (UPF0391 family)